MGTHIEDTPLHRGIVQDFGLKGEGVKILDGECLGNKYFYTPHSRCQNEVTSFVF